MKINLRDYYPAYHQDISIEVTEEIAEQLRQWERDEEAYQRKRKRYRAQYSLDYGDGIERDAVVSGLAPDEHYECQSTRQQLDEALATLPDKQAKRIYAHFILRISQADIARTERISTAAVNISIVRGLRRLMHYLKQNL